MIATLVISFAALAASAGQAADPVVSEMDDFCVPFMRSAETVETVRASMTAKGLKPGVGNAFSRGDVMVQVAESRDGLRTCSISSSLPFEEIYGRFSVGRTSIP